MYKLLQLSFIKIWYTCNFNSLQVQCTVQCVEQLWSQAAWWLLYSSAAGHWRPSLQERTLPARQCTLLWTLPHLSWSSLWEPGPCQYASGGKDGHHYCYSKPIKHNYMYLPLHVHVSLLFYLILIPPLCYMYALCISLVPSLHINILNFVASRFPFALFYIQLRATIGDVMCQFYIAEEKDPAMMVSFQPLPLQSPSFYTTIMIIIHVLFFSNLQLLSTRAKTLSVLRKLQQVSQVGLSMEPLYWLVYNALLLTYTLSRTMIKYDFHTCSNIRGIIASILLLVMGLQAWELKILFGGEGGGLIQSILLQGPGHPLKSYMYLSLPPKWGRSIVG